MLSGRPLAFVILAWSFLRVLVKQLTGQLTGLVKFHQNYGADRLVAITPPERAALEKFSRCIACGRCDIGEGRRIAESRGEYPGLMQLVLASSRNMPDFDAACRGFSHVSEAVLKSKVNRCPVRIPFPQLAAFVRDKARTELGDPPH